MFKGHPKGLIPAAIANMGERFGFYTMMAILVLFLQAKFNLDGANAGIIYSIFYFSIYILALVGGIIADKINNFKGTILTGLIMMGAGYFILAVPTPTPVSSVPFFLTVSLIGLFVIAFGNGLFKGNLQALVGQMYDDPKYGALRDSGFSLFYAFINIGAIFAPIVAIGMRNWWLGKNQLQYDASLPEYCHSFINGDISEASMHTFQEYADKASGVHVANLAEFADRYLNVFNTGFHYAFGTAIVAMAISLFIFIKNKKQFPNPKGTEALAAGSGYTKEEVKMEAKEIKQRMYALLAVFSVVIFFWFSFHQNGLTLTLFAKDYTVLKIGTWHFSVELFQSMNPFFVVFLTPVVVGIFGWLRARNMEPSTPKKIAIGMGIACLGFVVMMLGSFGLPLWETITPSAGGTPLMDSERVAPYLLLGTYFILTVAELFISPMGISFVSKVAPPQYQGLMQGGWLGATALGNGLLWIGAVLYQTIPVWMTWSIFVVATAISMFTVIFMVKWLERVSE
ncbi:MFS transporter [Labilibaculum sp. A4]|uniref:peptide MFS transporter n=1 Tax=Labilibaculum euxinus TaxID=2686357 RepID=UPI000F61F4C7|nr:peptide MFS transporter [Labilibaculum euxinus]MDQ1770924.1 peptide MFS transporter [Labilibaculum euxinus]MWN76094.1 MFS transporter [Labilibaculum euxinus]